MDIDLRDAIIQRVQNKSDDELRDVIESSIGGDDRTLPGLGVLFEKIWQHSDETLHQTMVGQLKDSLVP